MKQILEKINKELKQIDSEVKDQEKKHAQDKKILEQKAGEAETLTKRLENTTVDRQKIQSEYEAKRTERQNALFEGQDITAINKDLTKIKEKLEIKEDETISIQKKLDAVNAEIAKINESIAGADSELNELLRKREGYQICINYNAAAEPFALALQAYYDFLEKDRGNSRLFVFGGDYAGNKASIDIKEVAKLYVPEHQAVFHEYDLVPVPGYDGQTRQTNVRNHPETWNWFKK